MQKTDTERHAESSLIPGSESVSPSLPVDGGQDASTFRQLLETVTDGILITDRAGVVLEANRRAAELMHMSVETVKNRRIGELFSDTDGAIMAKVSAALEKGNEIRVILPVALGAEKVPPVSAVARRMHGGNALCFLLSPGPALAMPSEEMATAIGKVSHDLENLLTPLYSYPEMIRKDLPASSRGVRLLDVMEKTAKDMSLIVQQLVVLSKSGRSRTQVFSINGPVRRVAELIAHDADSKNIKLQLSLAEDLLSINGAPEQVLRVVQNLCKNAIDAISESGRIDIETENVYVDNASKPSADLKMGEYVRLRISDTGPGIPDEIRERMFEPFFTTKGDRGKGSGLGLSVVKDIVAEYHGSIAVSSRVGQGTTFELHFPVCRRDVPSSVSMKADAEAGQMVAIADDDATQRDIISKLLAYHGYKVKCFPDGEQLVESFVESGDLPQQSVDRPLEGVFPDVVFLDEEMGPGIDGKTACARILEINPKQHVVMMSSQAVHDDVKIESASGAVTCLKKPLTWAKMESALQVLDSRDQEEKESDGNLVPCAGGRVLIVDDEEGICKLFDMIIAAAFPLARLESCDNGEKAVELFSRNHHAVVILDLHMPAMNGHSVYLSIQALCQKNGWKTPSMIFCTGFAPPSVIKKIVNSSASHGLLTKPVSGEDLVRVVRKRLSF